MSSPSSSTSNNDNNTNNNDDTNNNNTIEKPTKYDITIKYTDKKIPFALEQMPGRPVGARINKIVDHKYESVASIEDILVAIDKTVVLKLGVHNINLMLHDLRHSQKGNHRPIVCRFVNANAAKNRQQKRQEEKKKFVSTYIHKSCLIYKHF